MIVVYTYEVINGQTHHKIGFTQHQLSLCSQTSAGIAKHTDTYGPSASVWIVPGTCEE